MGLIKWLDDMDRKVMILLYLVITVFTSINAKSGNYLFMLVFALLIIGIPTC